MKNVWRVESQTCVCSPNARSTPLPSNTSPTATPGTCPYMPSRAWSPSSALTSLEAFRSGFHDSCRHPATVQGGVHQHKIGCCCLDTIQCRDSLQPSITARGSLLRHCLGANRVPATRLQLYLCLHVSLMSGVGRSQCTLTLFFWCSSLIVSYCSRMAAFSALAATNAAILAWHAAWVREGSSGKPKATRRSSTPHGLCRLLFGQT